MSKHCLCGPVTFQEDETKAVGLYTNPYLCCESCGKVTKIPFSSVDDKGKALSINWKAVFVKENLADSLYNLESTVTDILTLFTVFVSNHYTYRFVSPFSPLCIVKVLGILYKIGYLRKVVI